jgi:hypothetical protein
MEPVKSFRIRRRDQKARRVWRELGMDDWRSATPRAAHAPTALPAPAFTQPVRDAGLRYEAYLGVGEIRGEQTAAGLTVRVGMPGRLAVLGSRWPTLLSLLFFGSLLVLNLYLAWWVQFRMMVRFGPGFGPRYAMFGLWFFVLLVLVGLDALKLARTLIFARGTVVLSASTAGLTYQNIPSWTPSGMIPRDDIESITVKYVAGIFRKEYQLQLRRHGVARGMTLFAGRDLAAIQRVRTDLAVALGIENVPVAEAAPDAAVTVGA